MIGRSLPGLAHILDLTDDRGTFEHAEGSRPRREHGYCTDDMARVLIVAVREGRSTPETTRLIETSMRFLNDAQAADGSFRNRMSVGRRWTDRATTDDCWGRSILGLGTAAARGHDASLRQAALLRFERAAARRSPHRRATAFAAVGAAEILAVQPDHRIARALLTSAADMLTETAANSEWSWPEPRLTYANAVLPEAMIASGHALELPQLLQRGLELLAWLLDHETLGDHLSVTPTSGAAPGDGRPGFDQQPIEVAALADACARAALIDGNRAWIAGIDAAAAWFLGANDMQVVMWDPTTSGGYDGLTPTGPNLNQGTESTLALLSTLQHAHRLAASPA